MSGPSHIAMLAQIRSDLMDATHAADVRIGSLKRAGSSKNGPDVTAAEHAMDHACRNSSDAGRLMLGQVPTDIADVLSLMLAATEATDAIQDYASADTPDTSEVVKLAELLDHAVSNIAVLLARSIQPRNAYERHVAGILTRRLAPDPVNAGGEA